MICNLCREDSSHELAHWDLWCGICGRAMCVHNESVWSGYCSKPVCDGAAATRAHHAQRKERKRLALLEKSRAASGVQRLA